jgi:transcriptional regulator GlxA family with amidase domain
MAFAVQHIADPLEVDDLARKAMMSRRTFDRRFRGVSGISAMRWLLQQRVLLAQRLLEESELPIDEIARRVGFTNGITLRRHFRRYLGASPLQHRISWLANYVVAV